MSAMSDLPELYESLSLVSAFFSSGLVALSASSFKRAPNALRNAVTVAWKSASSMVPLYSRVEASVSARPSGDSVGNRSIVVEYSAHTAAVLSRGSKLLSTFHAAGRKEGAEMRAMMPTTPAELGEVARLDSDGSRYRAIRSPTLILAGADSFPAVLPPMCRDLAGIIPDARYELLAGLGHNAPDNEAPTTVAARIAAAMAEV